MTYALPVDDARYLALRGWAGLKHDLHAGVADRGADRATTTLLTLATQAELDVLPERLLGSVGLELDGEVPGAAPTEPSPEPAMGWGPVGSVAYTPLRALSLTASVAARTRFPTLRERFSTVFGAREANPLLRPERAVNLSLDVAWRPLPELRVTAGVFDSELSDLITSVVVGPQLEQMQNAGRSRFDGVEAEVDWSFAPWVAASVGWMVLYARTGPSLAEKLAYRPDNKGLATLTVTPLEGLSLTAVLRHVGGQEFQNPDTGLWGHLGAYQLFDARLEYAPVPALRAWVRMTNLADTHVEGRYSFPEAGRQSFVGLGSSTGP